MVKYHLFTLYQSSSVTGATEERTEQHFFSVIPIQAEDLYRRCVLCFTLSRTYARAIGVMGSWSLSAVCFVLVLLSSLSRHRKDEWKEARSKPGDRERWMELTVLATIASIDSLSSPFVEDFFLEEFLLLKDLKRIDVDLEGMEG